MKAPRRHFSGSAPLASLPGGATLGGEGGQGEARSAPPPPSLSTCEQLQRPSSLSDYERSSQELARQSFALKGRVGKSAWALVRNCERLIDVHGINRIAFVTLTLPEQVEDFKEANILYHRANGTLHRWFDSWVVVNERQKSRRVHWHQLAVAKGDILSGFDWEAWQEWQWAKRMQDGAKEAALRAKWLGSANECLRWYWKPFTAAMAAHGFGRCEVLPVRSNAEAMAFYCGKYLGKHYENRLPIDKGCRLIRYSEEFPRMVKGRFNYARGHASLWRVAVGLIANELGITSAGGFNLRFGSRWCYRLRDLVELVQADLADGRVPRIVGQGEACLQMIERLKLQGMVKRAQWDRLHAAGEEAKREAVVHGIDARPAASTWRDWMAEWEGEQDKEFPWASGPDAECAGLSRAQGEQSNEGGGILCG